ncbi:glycosyl hydrolase family 95 catalytic domain-containing protein [Niabella hirudinis]|uniref:glycosyl hydrolase family 95 catalytic domain-containing protein n=1 Tax=Niabella hirudinis TaxID=1285929 RepID=UPI003EC0DBEE
MTRKQKITIRSLPLRIICTILLGIPVTITAQNNPAKEIVNRYHNVFNAPPVKTPGTVAVDAPLLGNGYTAAAMAGPPEAQYYYLARNDFWRLKSGFNESYPAVLGRLGINFSALKGAIYHVEQDLYTATTQSSFTKEATAVQLQSLLSATGDLLLITVTNTGTTALDGNFALELPGKDQFHVNPPLENKFEDVTQSGTDKTGAAWIERGFVKDVDQPTKATAACKLIGQDKQTLSLLPGQTAYLVCAFSGNFKSKEPLSSVLQKVHGFTIAAFKKETAQHRAWWSDYWNKSFVNIGDSVTEHQYYRSLYNMAACSRDPRFPPGIFGSWVTNEIPAWNGDYHLNYNYSAPFYALYGANRLEQALPYEAPLLDFMKRGRYYSQKITGISQGILYPVGIGPLGIETTRKNTLMEKYRSGYIKSGEAEDEGLFFGQKSNAAYGAVNLSMQFYRTYDKTFTRRVYPYIKAVAQFWDKYLKKEGGRYIIENDAIHEGTIGTLNPILSLGLVPMVLKTAIDMSTVLGVDQALRSSWQGKADSLAGYTTQEREGKTVFRYSEKGTAWWSDNTLGIQHIYPAGAIGLNSDARLLKVAHNTIDAMRRWKDFNGSNSFFPAAVRVGYNADTILKELRAYSLHTYPNGFQLNNPHGIENCSTVPNTINEMLCMGNQGVLRVFAVWPRSRNAAFTNIRSEGAFLVSSAIKDGEVQYIKVHSEQGRPVNLQNPWPGKELMIRSNKKSGSRRSGAQIMIPTSKGETLSIYKK